MTKYIELEAAIDAVTETYYDTPDINLNESRFEAALRSVPAANVMPVVHEWRIEKTAPDGRRYFECSKCGAHENKHTAIKGRYCWRCGAKMDGDMKMAEYTNKENCTECTHHNIFWEGSGCNLLNNMEHCKFEQKVKPDLSLLFASLEDIIDATD